MTSKLNISVSSQTLSLFQQGKLISAYKISSALNGVGQEKNSNKTPLGKHIIRAMIGGNLPIYSVIQGRRFTNQIWTNELKDTLATNDWILSRVIWLSGKEIGKKMVLCRLETLDVEYRSTFTRISEFRQQRSS